MKPERRGLSSDESTFRRRWRIGVMRLLTDWNRMDCLESGRQGAGSPFCDFRNEWPSNHTREVHRIPLVAISEDDDEYLIKAELPQVERRNVRVTTEDGALTIMGARIFEVNHRKDHPVGRAEGSYLHTFLLPADACPAKVYAEFRDGLLTVHLAKNPTSKPQHVEVQVA